MIDMKDYQNLNSGTMENAVACRSGYVIEAIHIDKPHERAYLHFDAKEFIYNEKEVRGKLLIQIIDNFLEFWGDTGAAAPQI